MLLTLLSFFSKRDSSAFKRNYNNYVNGNQSNGKSDGLLGTLRKTIDPSGSRSNGLHSNGSLVGEPLDEGSNSIRRLMETNNTRSI